MQEPFDADRMKMAKPTVMKFNLCGQCSQTFVVRDFFNIRNCRCPINLQCGHAVCELCLRTFMRPGTGMTCSICQTVTVPKSESLNDALFEEFSPNMYLMGHMVTSQGKRSFSEKDINFTPAGASFHHLKKNNKSDHRRGSSDTFCDECSNNAAVYHCEACNANLCQQCCKKVHQSKISKKHIYVHISKFKNRKNGEKWCDKHNRKIEFFCCSSTYCSYCIIKEHQGSEHKPIPVTEKNMNCVELLNSAAEEARLKLLRLKQTLKKTRSEMCTIGIGASSEKFKHNNIEQKLARYFSQLHGLLQLMEEKAMLEVSQARTIRERSLEKVQHDLESNIEHINSMLQEVQDGLEPTSLHYTDLSSLCTRLMETKDIPSFLVYQKSENNAELIFKLDEELKEAITKCCTISIPTEGEFQLLNEKDLPENYEIEPLQLEDTNSVCLKPSPAERLAAALKQAESRPRSSSNTQLSTTSSNENSSLNSFQDVVTPKIEIQENSAYHVYVCYVMNPGEFYVILNTNKGRLNLIRRKSVEHMEKEDVTPETVAKDVTVFSRISSGTNSTGGGRFQREINDRERRLIPYMTFYVAQSYQNPQSGERENVLIPVQGVQQDNVDQYNGVPQVQTNNIQNAQQYQLVPREVIMRLQEAGLLPISQAPAPQPNIEPNPQVAAQIYGFRSPGPQPQRLHQLQQLQQQQEQQYRQQQQEQQHRQQQHDSYQSLLKSQQESKYEKYLAPQLVKLLPTNYIPRERPSKYFPQNIYTSTKLQAYVPNSHNPNYYKPQQETYAPNKVYTLNISPPNNQKLIYQRVRPRQREEKAKYSSTKLYLTTTPSPYTNKVKFELEDARVPNSVQLEQIKAITVTELHSTPGTYTRPENSGSGLSDYLEPEKTQPETYYKPERQPVEYVPEVNTAIPVSNDISQPTPQTLEYNEYVDEKLINKPNAENVLTILKQTNQLSQNFTPDNIGGNVKTLALILEKLKQPEKKPHRFQVPSSIVNKEKPPKVQVQVEEYKPKSHNYPASSGTSTPGKPGIDYPIYATIPQTRFDCSTQRYKGFFGDPETHCQVWHYCDLNGGQASFLCPNGTIFNQVALTCDWWFNVRCASTSQLYVLNERLYKYILPFSPSFPEDYSGPIVDRYLTAKFKEMEAKNRIKALKALITTPKPEETTPPTISISTEASPTYEQETE